MHNRRMDTLTQFIDPNGFVWVEYAHPSPTRVKRILNSYKRAGIFLSVKGTR